MSVGKILADVGRVPDPPKNILAGDLNAENITAGDGDNTVQFDLSGSVNGILDAKICDADYASYDRAHDDVEYNFGPAARHRTRPKRRSGQANTSQRRTEIAQESQAEAE